MCNITKSLRIKGSLKLQDRLTGFKKNEKFSDMISESAFQLTY